MFQIQIVEHVLKRPGRFLHSPLCVLRVFQMIQEQLCDESTLDDVTAPTEFVDSCCNGRVDSNGEVN